MKPFGLIAHRSPEERLIVQDGSGGALPQGGRRNQGIFSVSQRRL